MLEIWCLTECSAILVWNIFIILRGHSFVILVKIKLEGCVFSWNGTLNKQYLKIEQMKLRINYKSLHIETWKYDTDRNSGVLILIYLWGKSMT